MSSLMRLQAVEEQLRNYIPLAQKVMSQTERRILQNERVAASDKIVSIFEPHTDIIIKDNRDTCCGPQDLPDRGGLESRPRSGGARGPSTGLEVHRTRSWRSA